MPGWIGSIGDGLAQGFSMFWETLWALVLGFTLSGAVQAFVSRGRMERVLGGSGPRTYARATFLGMVSSSCSYAASALAKTLVAKGADFTAALIFMIASTNLVIELGVVLALLIGWQFTLSEFAGGLLMITLLALLSRFLLPARLVEAARRRLAAAAPPDDAHATHAAPGGDDPDGDGEPGRPRFRTLGGWSDAARYTIADITMVRRELLIGFVAAGLISALVPADVWSHLFISGHGFWSSLENVVIGPLIAILSFVCSIGNVPLAAALWKGGISFGGVLAFIFADLITFPLLMIYRGYYGQRLTLWILGVFWLAMSASGLAVEYLFAGAGAIPTSRPAQLAPSGISLDYTTVLDVIALAVLAALYVLHRRRDRIAGGQRFARDPICGMQVEKINAAARRPHGAGFVYFCCDGCATAYDRDSTPAVDRTAPQAHS